MASVQRSRFSKALPSAPVEMALPPPPKEQISITRRPIRPAKKANSVESLSAFYNDYMTGLSSPKSGESPMVDVSSKVERKESPLPPPPSMTRKPIPEREIPPQPMGNKISRFKNGPGNQVFPVKPSAKSQRVDLKDDAVPGFRTREDPAVENIPTPLFQKRKDSLPREESSLPAPRPPKSYIPKSLPSPDHTKSPPQSYPRLPTPEYTSSTEQRPVLPLPTPSTPPAETVSFPQPGVAQPLLRTKAAEGFELNVVQFECYHKHKNMRLAENKLCPTKCMVCKKGEGRRWWCTWCCLGVCERCRGQLRKGRGDLMALLGG